jgi:thiopeptide-type bacteriocin biosynthesis protein
MTDVLDNKSKSIETSVTWIAAHLFYNGDFNVFLIKAVKPFIEKMLLKYEIENYFFIRYWENGPHIRLRFKGKSEILEQSIKPEISSFFSDYFTKNPSQRNDQFLIQDQKWHPNNSILFIEYEPETDRYGGEQALLIAEQQFRFSSEAILEILCDETWSYQTALGTAIKMHLSFAKAMGLSKEEMQLFFKSTFHGWFYYAYPPKDLNSTVEQLNEHKDKIMKAFAEVFENQKAQLISFHSSFLEAYDSRLEFEEQWLNDWIKQNHQIKTSLEKVTFTGSIPQYWQLLNKTAGVPADKERLWNILESYVHMTNNRLGIMNRDEAYLGYLIQESLILIS